MAAEGRETIALLGQRGLIKEIVAQTLHARGHRVVSKLLSTDPYGVDIDIDIDIAMLIDPRSEDWDVASMIGTPIVVMLDGTVSHDVAIDLLLAGADAVVSTSNDHATIQRAIDTVATGEVLLPRALAEAVLQRLRATSARGPSIELTRREREILDSIARGDAIKQTARGLGITVKTVQNLQSRLFRKLGSRNRAQAITRAHELGLL